MAVEAAMAAAVALVIYQYKMARIIGVAIARLQHDLRRLMAKALLLASCRSPSWHREIVVSEAITLAIMRSSLS